MDVDLLIKAEEILDHHMTNEILEHVGIKGMKWGVRKEGSKKSPVPRAAARTYDTKHLSNTELKKVVARMKLEQQYVEMNKKNQSEGKKWVEEFATTGRKTLIGIAIAATVGKVLKDVLEDQTKPASTKAVKTAARLTKKYGHLIKGARAVADTQGSLF